MCKSSNNLFPLALFPFSLSMHLFAGFTFLLSQKQHRSLLVKFREQKILMARECLYEHHILALGPWPQPNARFGAKVH